MTIKMPLLQGRYPATSYLKLETKTLDQALTQARNHKGKDFTETCTTVWLSDPVDEWKRVQINRGLTYK